MGGGVRHQRSGYARAHDDPLGAHPVPELAPPSCNVVRNRPLDLRPLGRPVHARRAQKVHHLRLVENGVEHRPDFFGTSGEKAGQVEYLHVFEAIAAENFSDRTQWKLAERVKVHVSCALHEVGKHCGDKSLVLGRGKLVGSRSAGGEEGLWEPADQHRVVE